MAKTVRQQLADIAGGKKPNVFYKGLNADTDEHLVGNDQFTNGVNVRLNSKDSDLGTIQNLKSNKKEATLGLPGWILRPSIALNKVFWHGGGTLTSGQDENLSNITLQFKKDGSSFFQFPSNDNTNSIDIGFTFVDFTFGRAYQPKSHNYTVNEVILHIYDKLKNDTDFTDVMTVTLGTQNGAQKGAHFILYFFPKDTTQIPLPGEPLLVTTTLDNTAATVNPHANTYNGTPSNSYFAADGFSLYPLGLVSYTNYIVAVCFHTSSIQAVVKLYTSATGAITSLEPIVISDFGLSSKNDAITLQKVEENENYNRIYWSDGINPIKTVNLEATGSFYNDFVDNEDFNLFTKSPIEPLQLENVTDSGSINCGSWSYTYRFKTPDGKSSVYAPITNPIPLSNSLTNTSSHLIEGGVISDNSGKSVTLKIPIVQKVYNTIELIGIQYIDDVGAIFYKIKEESLGEQLSSNQLNFVTHNGNEAATVITASEVLTKKNTWDVAQDLEVKDNRLFASNLKNNTDEVVSDFNTFKVKSFKHSAGSSTFGTPSSGTYATYADTFINPDLYEAELYKIVGTDTAKYRYAQGDTAVRDLSFGANSTNYHTATTGVYVTFKLKQFDLNDINYWHSTRNPGTKDGFNIPPFISTSQTTIGGYNNYKNAVFANKFVGYMRDEVYRFGIQFYDKSGNQSFTYPVGDIRFPAIENDYRVLGTTAGTYTTTTTNQPNKYILADSNGKGYILYPEFRVKLSLAIRNKISGFNIVRAERSDSDKRIVAAGLLNNTLIYANDVENKSLKNKIGLEKINLFAQFTGSFAAFRSELYTLDSPEILFNRINYSKSGTQNLKICSKFLAKSYPISDGPGSASNAILAIDSSNVSWMADISTDSTFYAATLDVDHTTTPNAIDTAEGSMYTIYFCDDAADSPLVLPGSTAASYTKAIFYGQNVGGDEFVSNALLGSSRDFQNRTEVYTTNNLTAVSVNNSNDNFIENSASKTMIGNKTLLLSLNNNETFTLNGSNVFNETTSTNRVDEKYYAAKPYAKIIRQYTNESGQYGGNTDNVLISQRWISTGASLHGDSITANEMILDVFGGDTFLNMFSINKFNQPSFNSGSTNRIVQGLIHPVESSINLDMRRGIYFGKNKANLQVEDDYLCARSYSAKNNLKSFPAKDPAIALVSNFENLIAASNVKIAGQTNDAFSVFDANENFALDMNHGPIKNLIKFRDVLYAIQEKAIAILSINARALINAEDGSSISIQSSLGTGNVIERSDYISTKHGSQNRLNAMSTDMGLYWVDSNNASICVISAKQPNLVVNLSQQKNISNLLDPIKSVKINDNPLNVSGTSGGEGGINISYNLYLNEILFSVTYLDSTLKELTIAYDESLEVFLGTRSYSTILNCTHQGYLYSVGYENTDTLSATDTQRREVYSHFSSATTFNNFYGTAGDNPSVTFVNNEEVVSLKVYDKIVVSTQEIVTNGIFSKFAYNTNLDSVEDLNLATSDIDKVIVGKQIVPVFVTKRMKGNYLKVKIEQGTNQSSQDFNLFSVTSHYRKNII